MSKITKSGALGSAAVLAGGSASALLLALTAAPGGAATTLTVDSLSDGAAVAADCTTPVADSCSLRDALAAAASGDVITFKAGLSGTMTLTEGYLPVMDSLTLTGAGSEVITIDGNESDAVFYITVDAGDVTISGLTITGASDSGVYALNNGNLALTDVDVSGNVGGYGAGLYINSIGTFTLTDSNVSNNVGSDNGGGIYIFEEVTGATITNTTIVDNSAESAGGGIYGSFTGDLTIINSTISGNTSEDYGGGIYTENYGDLNLTNTVVSDNLAAEGGGGVYTSNSGSVTITGSAFSGNYSGSWGGALYLGTEGQAITISNSTFNGNSAVENGGAIDFDADNQDVTINNTTITGNSSGSDGGGFFKDVGGSLTINQSTITENTAVDGGGFYVRSGQTVALSGTIVSNNTLVVSPVAVPSDVLGADILMEWEDGDVLSLDHSLVGLVNDTAEAEITDLGGNIRSSTPGLSALADNGGMTQTMALLSTSEAVDAGPNPVATFFGNEFDQRGVGYARVYGTSVDIGAFEIQAPPAPSTTTAAAAPVVPTFAG